MKGIYVLEIEVNRDFAKKIGALGIISFRRGIHLYVGSAQNNLEKRIKRHMSDNKKLRWHIDYLLANARIRGVYYKKATKNEECRLAMELAENHEPVKGFGCSDCRCTSHLFRVLDEFKLQGFRKVNEVV